MLLPVGDAARSRLEFVLAERRRRRAAATDDGGIVGRAIAAARDEVRGAVDASLRRGSVDERRCLKVDVDGREHHRLGDRAAPTATTALRRSLVAVHTLLAVDDGAFVSLLDPPD